MCKEYVRSSVFVNSHIDGAVIDVKYIVCLVTFGHLCFDLANNRIKKIIE